MRTRTRTRDGASRSRVARIACIAMWCVAASVARAAHVRPMRRGAGLERASNVKVGRARTITPPHDGFGARRGHGRDHRGERAHAHASAAAAHAAHASRRRDGAREDEEATRGASRRRRLQADGGETATQSRASAADAYAIDDAATFVPWASLDAAPDDVTCDGCKLTARALFADAVASSRTTRASSWKALDESIRESVLELVWSETTCARMVNVTALRRDERGRLVDARQDTRESEISNPSEARVAPENATDTIAVSMLERMCVLLRDDAQARDWLVSSLSAIADVRPLSDAQARFACDVLSPDDACSVRDVRDEL